MIGREACSFSMHFRSKTGTNSMISMMSDDDPLPGKMPVLSASSATEIGTSAALLSHRSLSGSSCNEVESFSTSELSMAHLQKSIREHHESTLKQDFSRFRKFLFSFWWSGVPSWLCPRCLKHTPLLRSRSKLSHHPGHTGGNYCYNLADTQYCTIKSTGFLHKIMMMTCTTPAPSRPKTCRRKEWPSVASGTLRLDSIDGIARFRWTTLTGYNHNMCSANLRHDMLLKNPNYRLQTDECSS